jgi:hypothetical protein
MQRVPLLFSGSHCPCSGCRYFSAGHTAHAAGAAAFQRVPTAQAAGAAAFAASPQNNLISALPSPQILHILEVHSQRKLLSLYNLLVPARNEQV